MVYIYMYVYMVSMYMHSVYPHTLPSALRILSLAGSPAYIPDMKGSMMRENTSGPGRSGQVRRPGGRGVYVNRDEEEVSLLGDIKDGK
jgi:hypothetical protein